MDGIGSLILHRHIEVDTAHHGNIFFWLYENRHIGDRQRTVIWLNGGPGCSSMDGALMEIGPYRVLDQGKLQYNNGSWDEFANVIFIDNPVGTGFSYVEGDAYLHELQDMADQMMIFLEKFFQLFPQYESDDLYIAGESYAGQHIPYIARSILDRNKKNVLASQWNLKGLMIGNGWISGPDQYPSYLKFAYQNGLIEQGSEKAKMIEAQQAVCLQKLSSGGSEHVDTPECENILQLILAQSQDTSASKDKQCVNMYDVRKRDSYPSCGMNWPPDLATVTPYLRDQSVIHALHVNPDKRTGWQECSGSVSSNFNVRESAPSVKLLPDLLAEIPILLFSGDKDLICNHVGTESIINNLEWNGGKGMEVSPGTWAPRRQWTFEDEAAGYWQEARNLTYVVFYNSSHMVPFDYPRRTRDMLDRFMGVDIAGIGGMPANSRLDGEKGMETSVGGHPNSTAAQQEAKEKISQAEWNAYYRAGEVALVVIIIAAGAWGYYVYKDRTRRAGYQGINFQGSVGGIVNGIARNSIPGFEGYRSPLRSPSIHSPAGNGRRRDLEAADFDVSNELMPIDARRKANEALGQDDYRLGSDSEDDAGSSSNGHSRPREKH